MKFYSLIGVFILFFAWQLLSWAKILDSFLLPDPLITLNEFIRIIIDGQIGADLFQTLARVFVSFLIAALLGIPLGLALGSSEKLYRSFEFIIDFFRSTPATALFPLFMLIFGIGDQSKIAVATFGALLIIIFNVAYGVIHAKKQRLLAARIMGATRLQTFKYVLFWESLPQIVIGLRSAISICLIIIIVTEMFIGTKAGLGRKIIDYQITYSITSMYATIILTGLIGYLLNLFFVILERRVIHWSAK